ncbi:MAG: spore germination protein GerW family protein [Desulfotomaculaceae bacterium]|nr:spore germination protein GerW family protein [Desulfotomaculaceae bacterium]MDD4766976.1 spore germination protein GerW family protein [Desulfotomaculaceae bacterium]
MFQESIDSIVSRLENLIKTKTIVGEPINAGNTTIIPVMSASFGFATGVGEGTEPGKGGGKGGGGGAGARVTPAALIIIRDGEVDVYNLGQKGSLEKLAKIIPDIVSKFSKEGTSAE